MNTLNTHNEWRSRPIFVSSTFLDMQAERDYLNSVVWPELSEFLRQRRHELIPIDLRWGVETLNIDVEMEKEIHVLKVCMKEIERSRPFMIVLLGDRYGWIPPVDRVKAAAYEAGLSPELLTGKSVTAMEIEFGIMSNPEQAVRSFFYLRSSLPYESMKAETAALYSDDHSITKEASKELKHLKKRIRDQFEPVDRVRDYKVNWNSENESVTGLETFGQMVLQDLKSVLEEETQEFIRMPPITWEEHERRTIDDFVSLGVMKFVGREKLIGEIVDLALRKGPNKKLQGICIIGEAGSGKSMLFAKLHSIFFKQKDVLVLSNAAGISNRSSYFDNILFRWIGELAVHLRVDSPVTESTDHNGLYHAFSDLLIRASDQYRVLLLLDALNQLERSPAVEEMTWLPHPLPLNSFIIATSQPDKTTDSLARLPYFNLKYIESLTISEASEIIKSICNRYHKTLNTEVLAEIWKKDRQDSQPAASNPLWLAMTIELLLLLDKDDFSLGATKYFMASPEQKIVLMMCDIVKELPNSARPLYLYLVKRFGKMYGEKLVFYFVKLIAISRSGWREQDFLALLPKLADVPCNSLIFSILRRGFRGHIIQRSIPRRWDFFHIEMREVLFYSDAAERKSLHVKIADYLETLDQNDPMRETEFFFHLIGADDRERASFHYAKMKEGRSSDNANFAFAHLILEGREQSPNPGIEWVVSLTKIKSFRGVGRIQGDLVANSLALKLPDVLARWGGSQSLLVEFLNKLFHTVEELQREEFDPRIRNLMRESGDDPPERTIGVILEQLAHCEQKTGLMDNALNHLERSRQIFETILEERPFYRRAHDLEQVLRSQAELFEKLGLKEKTERIRQRMLILRERIKSEDPRKSSNGIDVIAFFNQVSQLVHMGRKTEALNILSENLPRMDSETSSSQKIKHVIAVGQSHCVYAELLGEKKHDNEALIAWREGIELIERAYRTEPTSQISVYLATGYHRMADYQKTLGDIAEAIDNQQKAVMIFRRIHENEKRTDIARNLATGLNYLAMVLKSSGRNDEAKESALEAHLLFENLHQQMPTGLSAQDLATSHQNLIGFADSDDEKSNHLLQCINVFESAIRSGLKLSAEAHAIFSLMTMKHKNGIPMYNEKPVKKSEATYAEKRDYISRAEESEKQDLNELSFLLPMFELHHYTFPSSASAQRLLRCYARIIDAEQQLTPDKFISELLSEFLDVALWCDENRIPLQEDILYFKDILLQSSRIKAAAPPWLKYLKQPINEQESLFISARKQEEIARELQWPEGVLDACLHQAAFYVERGEKKKSHSILKQAGRLNYEFPDNMILTKLIEGLMCRAWGKPEEALEILNETEKLALSQGDRRQASKALINRAFILMYALNKTHKAVDVAAKAMDYAKQTENVAIWEYAAYVLTIAKSEQQRHLFQHGLKLSHKIVGTMGIDHRSTWIARFKHILSKFLNLLKHDIDIK